MLIWVNKWSRVTACEVVVRIGRRIDDAGMSLRLKIGRWGGVHCLQMSRQVLLMMMMVEWHGHGGVRIVAIRKRRVVSNGYGRVRTAGALIDGREITATTATATATAHRLRQWSIQTRLWTVVVEVMRRRGLTTVERVVSQMTVVILGSFNRRAIPDEPDDDEYQKQAEYVAEHDHNEPHAVVLLCIHHRRRYGRRECVYRWQCRRYIFRYLRHT